MILNALPAVPVAGNNLKGGQITLKNLPKQLILNVRKGCMLEQESAFYDAHQAEFHEKYLDKWLVITGESLWGVYDKFVEATKAALGSLEPGKFMIHKPSDDGKIIYVGPRAHIGYLESSKKPKPQREIVYSGGSDLLKVSYPY